MKTVMITAFEPFGGSRRNSSLDTLRSLPETVGEARIVKAELPVEYDGAAQKLRDLFEGNPRIDAVLCLGQAEGRGTVTPEYVAVNVRNGSLPDNAGKLCRFEPCEPGGPDGILATLPVPSIAERLTKKKIPASVSFTAGAYVCNSTMYTALRLTEGTGTKAGFIHLPLSAEIALEEGKAGRVLSLPQSVLTEAIREAVLEITGQD